MPKAPAIPTSLTVNDWNSKKGVVAKLVKGETGIGAAMAAVKTEYDKVDWTKYDATATTPSSTFCLPAHADAAFQAGKTEYTKIEEVRKKLVALRDLAKTTAESWKKNKLIPSSSREHAEKISKDADAMWGQLKDNGPFFTQFKEACDAVKKLLANNVEKVKPGERPADFNHTWWLARKPTVGWEEDPKLKTKMDYFWDHYTKYVALDKNSTDDTVMNSRINCLRQMTPGINQSETAILAMIDQCKPVLHVNTKIALQHYITLLAGYKQQRKQWVIQEKTRANTNTNLKAKMVEKLTGDPDYA